MKMENQEERSKKNYEHCKNKMRETEKGRTKVEIMGRENETISRQSNREEGLWKQKWEREIKVQMGQGDPELEIQFQVQAF